MRNPVSFVHVPSGHVIYEQHNPADHARPWRFKGTLYCFETREQASSFVEGWLASLELGDRERSSEDHDPEEAARQRQKQRDREHREDHESRVALRAAQMEHLKFQSFHAGQDIALYERHVNALSGIESALHQIAEVLAAMGKPK